MKMGNEAMPKKRDFKMFMVLARELSWEEDDGAFGYAIRGCTIRLDPDYAEARNLVRDGKVEPVHYEELEAQ